MQREVHHITIEKNSSSELLRVAREVQRSGIPAIIHADGEEIAQITPAPAKHAQELPPKGEGANDWFMPLIGSAKSDGATDVGRNADKYLAQAIYEEFRPKSP